MRRRDSSSSRSPCSAIDPLLVCNLLQRDFAVLVRPGARASLVFRALLALADGLIVEEPRERGRARDAEPAVALLHRGLSLVVAPEAPRLVGLREGPLRIARGLAKRAYSPTRTLS